jgi:hypothetical protein
LHLNALTGWVEGSNQELVIWIPPEFSDHLCLYPQLLVLGGSPSKFQLATNVPHYESLHQLTSLLHNHDTSDDHLMTTQFEHTIQC